jgi:hypothetical protein
MIFYWLYVIRSFFGYRFSTNGRTTYERRPTLSKGAKTVEAKNGRLRIMESDQKVATKRQTTEKHNTSKEGNANQSLLGKQIRSINCMFVMLLQLGHIGSK